MTTSGRTDPQNKRKSWNRAPHLDEMSLYKLDDRQNKHTSVHYIWINLLKLWVYIRSYRQSLLYALLPSGPSIQPHSQCIMGYWQSKTVMTEKSTFRKVHIFKNISQLSSIWEGCDSSYVLFLCSLDVLPLYRLNPHHPWMFFSTSWPLVVQYSNILCRAGSSFFLTQ